MICATTAACLIIILSIGVNAGVPVVSEWAQYKPYEPEVTTNKTKTVSLTVNDGMNPSSSESPSPVEMSRVHAVPHNIINFEKINKINNNMLPIRAQPHYDFAYKQQPSRYQMPIQFERPNYQRVSVQDECTAGSIIMSVGSQLRKAGECVLYTCVSYAGQANLQIQRCNTACDGSQMCQQSDPNAKFPSCCPKMITTFEDRISYQ